MLRLGVIGYGDRVQGMLGMIERLDAGVELVAITDIRNDEIKKEMKEKGRDPEKITFYTDPDKILGNEQLDGVMVGTRCSTHAKMAIKVLVRSLPLFLEKPVATNMPDLLALRNAAERSTSEVVVSFPLKMSPHVRLVKEIIDSGKIGTVEHVQAWNNVPYGACYYHLWYRDENETGGLFLQKATHDFDYINYLLGIQPIWICAMTSKQVYKGNHPDGLRCNVCTEWDSCLESPYHRYYTKHETSHVKPFDDLMCGFAVDTGNEDSGSALIQYETGMHVCYSQNFFARRKAGKRGATLLGYKGTIEFDWYTDEVKVYMHHSPREESYRVETLAETHGGGDIVLADNFVRVMRHQQKSFSTLSAGMLSVLMCLKAKESAQTRTFQEIKWQ